MPEFGQRWDDTPDTLGWRDAGTRHTLESMRSLIIASAHDPTVVELGRRLAVVGGVRHPVQQAQAIQAWLKRVWRFVDDPVDDELLIPPVVLVATFERLGFIPGDCDEAAVLGAALARAVGLHATLTVYAFGGAETITPDGLPDVGPDLFAHVFASILTPDGKPISLDITRPAGPVAVATRVVTIDV